MVFDLRGRRRYVVKVVYAILALLMAISLFIVVGPINIGSLIGSGATSSASDVLEEQVDNVEAKLRRKPNDPQLLLSLTRARASLANSLAEVSATGQPQQTVASREQLQKATSAWEEYVKASGKQASTSGAQLAAGLYFTLAQTSRTYPEAKRNLQSAASAERIVAENTPSIGSLSTLAIYHYIAGDRKAAEAAEKRALAQANSKQEEKALTKQFAAVKKQGKEFTERAKKAAKAEKGRGKEALENPFGGLGGEPSLTP
jgi:colicin import membrane protein